MKIGLENNFFDSSSSFELASDLFNEIGWVIFFFFSVGSA